MHPGASCRWSPRNTLAGWSPGHPGGMSNPREESLPFARRRRLRRERTEACWGEVALDAFRTPWRRLGAAGCAAGAEVKPGSLEGPGLAETPGAEWAISPLESTVVGRLGGGRNQDEVVSQTPKEEPCKGEETVSAVKGQTRAGVGGMPWGDGVGAAGDSTSRVQKAFTGLSVKRKSGHRRSEIQEALVLGTVIKQKGRWVEKWSRDSGGGLRRGLDRPRHRWEKAGPGAPGQLEGWNDGEVWTFSSV